METAFVLTVSKGADFRRASSNLPGVHKLRTSIFLSTVEMDTFYSYENICSVTRQYLDSLQLDGLDV